MMAKRKGYLSPWQCESADDYYAQFENVGCNEDDFEKPNDLDESNDQDCEYWQRVMRNY
ncbi:hypothetical protein [Mannheimia pernigra]|uniref:hypothetical protein n=1 Tax=Mannheimia pernigra TaxID=111844 RepID=UPI00159F56DC|nr:hypothetical protein [Mannheimia pernigra]QLB43265.1 hypothetical protein HV561_06250 [Mannheimia pernigra]QLB43267.1 hypothetical protein HV561_06630 [Mannheimia pernigra]